MLASAPEDIEHQVQAAVAAILAAKPIGGQEHVAALRALRQLLSNCACVYLACCIVAPPLRLSTNP